MNPGVPSSPLHDAHIWPIGAGVDADGVLTVGGLRATDLAAEFGTPAYLLDEDDFRSRARRWRTAFADADVFYAGKAFLCTAVARWVAEEGLGLDVCTGGELAVALRAGFDPARLQFHGNNKSVPEMRRAVEVRVGRVVVDSFDEIDRLARIAADAGTVQRVMVRVTPGVEAHTHEFISTGQEDQKFGFSLSTGSAAKAILAVEGHRSLELVGLHAHIGSQIFDAAGFELAAHRMAELLSLTTTQLGREVRELNLGGGVGIAYVSGDDPMDIGDFANQLRAIVNTECDRAGIAVPRLAVEPGRSIVGPSTVTLYEVGTVKELPGLRTYVSVDGGMSDNIRTALYDACYTALLANRASSAPDKTVTICGKHCESGDIVVRDVALPDDVRPGDLIAVPASGAYQRSMANNYNHVPRPPVVAIRGGEARVIVRRETEADLLRLDAEA
ncbi:MAG: diaminopimelate decarboxylase [Mycobacteriales bacterium]